METNVDLTFNAITILTSIFAWGVIFFFAYRIYQKQIVKPKIWRIIIVIYVGLFSFSINLTLFDSMLKFSILPLGVWVLYFVLKGKNERWQVYRSFAWLGFWANFIFLASTLIAMPIHQMIYPKEEPTTYLSNIENVSIIGIHPSAKSQSLNKEGLSKQLHTLRQEPIYSDQWYDDTYMNPETNKRNERFPYQLIGTSSKWGSGFHTMIFIEEDGKGFLVTTSKHQRYFRSEDSLLEEENKQ